MQLFQRTGLEQEQRLGLKLSPRILQSVKLMEFPVVELREKIAEELEKNPALEIIKDRTEISLNEMDSPPGEEKTYFETSSDSGFLHSGRGEQEADEHRQFIEGVLSRGETLQEYLLFQIRLQPVSPEVRALGELFIQNLSSDGFHKEAIALLAKNADQKDIQAALDTVRRLDPHGCCTSDYKESLAVQAEIRFKKEADDIKALIPYMELLERDKITPAERALKKNKKELYEFFEKLKTLNPFPGRQFASGSGGGASGETRYVVPDVRVVRSEGEFKIIINNETIPVLGIIPFFKQHENAKNPEERDFVRENLQDARWFINALNRRNHTLFRVSKAIVHFQRSFFEQGPQHIVPLSQSDIAAKLEVHETTVSRAANGKYMETEWGIFEIRRFFTNSISGAGSSGSRYSHEAVKEIIREIILGEEKPMTDGDIVQLLAERGIQLARRTVAKYRSQLDLDSSYRR